MRQINLKPAGLVAETTSVPPADFNLTKYRSLAIELNVAEAERDSSDETFDIFITTGDGIASWDLAHFPQIASTGAKQFLVRAVRDVQPSQVTTDALGVSEVESGTLAMGAGQANVVKSLGAGVVRHGPWDDYLGYEVVIAGTVATGIDFSITITALP